MRDDHPAPRPERCALDVVPGVLGDGDRVRVFHRGRGGVAVADGEPAHLCRGPHVGLEQRGRERLRGRHVVEVAEVGVRGEPAARIDVEREEIADHPLVLGPVQALEAARPRVGIARGREIDRRLERLGEGEECGIVRAWGPRWGHHPGAELEDHPLRRLGLDVGLRHVEALEREVPRDELVVVAGHAVLTDHRVQVLGGGVRACALRASGGRGVEGQRGEAGAYGKRLAGIRGACARRERGPEEKGGHHGCLHAALSGTDFATCNYPFPLCGARNSGLSRTPSARRCRREGAPSLDGRRGGSEHPPGNGGGPPGAGEAGDAMVGSCGGGS